MQSKISLQDILNKKHREKITCLTAYTYPIAKAIDGICDIILVGDSLGMCVYGFKDTVDVTVPMMIDHGKAVMRGASKSFVVVDIPCNSFENSDEQAFETAKEIFHETKCDAVKIETSLSTISAIKLIADNGIPIMAHVGLLPQQVRKIGGYKYQGREKNQAAEILEIAKQAQNAGAFAIVIEAVPQKLADEITLELKIPTIGIGASLNCDGQILVIDDVIGLNQDFKPKFVKNYDNLAQKVQNSAQNYVNEVKNKIFPGKENLVD